MRFLLPAWRPCRRALHRSWLLAGVPVCLALSGCGEKETATAEPQPVAYVTAETRAISQTVSLTGEIAARNSSTYSFETGGRVTDVFVDVGDQVASGTVLAKIDPTDQQAGVAAAKAAVQSAEAQLENATASFNRQKQLLSSGFTTRSDYDSAAAQQTSAQSTLDSAKADLTNAEKDLSNTVLRADAAGVITSREVDPGQVVSAAQAAFGFARSGAEDAIFQIQEQLLIGNKKPDSIEVSLVSDPSVKARGYIREVSPLIDSSTGTVEVKIGIDNPPPEMTLGSAVVGHETGETSRQAVSLPWEALMVKGGKPAVWVVDEAGSAKLTPIEVAAYQTGTILVAGGVEAGERVVTAGSQLVLPGAALDLVQASSEGGERR
ncbi:efflux RND transporter periplasmic adaptor subunit [Jiella endophytica]|uniref:Efflux RND transporter periplasmic adaptor subunit n=1 Tax=Jiella endophytica TaxID=2558362 RepID=A0A4Y8RPR2_9HYPH|nr:efflux RND transporter periplasmic adaptor subunit [Jiella endophytica]